MLIRALLSLCVVFQIPVVSAGNMIFSSARYEVIYPGYSPTAAVEAVHDGYSQFLMPAKKSVRFLPNPMPTHPEAPIQKMGSLGPVSIPDIDCPTAYAEFTSSTTAARNALGRSGEIYRGCLYAFEKGFKLYGLVISYKASSTGLGLSLVNGLTKMVQGSDAENSERMTSRQIERLRESAPDMLVARIEVPGLPVSEPNLAEINEKIPEALKSSPSGAVTPTQSSPMAFSGALIPVNMAMTPPSAPAAVAPSPKNEMIEARKDLTAMGLTYHDQAQFVQTILRHDSLAADLFIKSGGVDLAAVDELGRTPVDVAIEAGKVRMALLIMNARIKALTNEKGVDAVATVSPPKQGSLADMRNYLQRLEALPSPKAM